MSTLPQATGTSRENPNVNSLPSLRERVRQATKQIESEIILETLEQHRWNRRRTAEALRISYRLLMYKMKSGNLRDNTLVQRSSAP